MFQLVADRGQVGTFAEQSGKRFDGHWWRLGSDG
jgi:hypothetical protein